MATPLDRLLGDVFKPLHALTDESFTLDGRGIMGSFSPLSAEAQLAQYGKEDPVTLQVEILEAQAQWAQWAPTDAQLLRKIVLRGQERYQVMQVERDGLHVRLYLRVSR